MKFAAVLTLVALLFFGCSFFEDPIPYTLTYGTLSSVGAGDSLDCTMTANTGNADLLSIEKLVISGITKPAASWANVDIFLIKGTMTVQIADGVHLYGGQTYTFTDTGYYNSVACQTTYEKFSSFYDDNSTGDWIVRIHSNETSDSYTLEFNSIVMDIWVYP